LRMYVKGFNANGGQKLVGHKTQYAESTDGGNTFQMQQQLVLDSASVPEGVEISATMKLESISNSDTICPKQNTKLEAIVKANPSFLSLTYEWSKNGIKLSNGGTISGANTGSLTIAQCTQIDTGVYTLKVTADGLSEGTLQQVFGPIKLTMNPQTEIIQDIDTTYAACHDETISIQNNSSSTIQNIRCVIVGACGIDTSNTATITFTSKAEIVQDLPAKMEIYSGMDTILNVKVNAESYTYQWYRNQQAITQEIPGEQEVISLNIVAMDTSDEGQYHAMIRTTCDTLTSQKTMLNMKVMSSVKEMSEIRVFPHPADNVINIENVDRSISQLKVYDMFGTTIRSTEIQEGKAFILTEDIPSGVYILRMDSRSIPITIIH
jgi:hypothetical protein